MAEYSRLARGRFVSTGAAQVVNLPFQPDRVRLLNYTTANTAATSQNVVSAEWDAYMGQGFAVQQGYNATPTLIYDTVIANGISTFAAGQLLQFGPTLTVTDVTKAAAALVTTSTAHGLKSGDVVILEGLFQTTTTGMPQINGIPFTVTVISATTFTIPWNTNQSNYTVISVAATGTPRAKKVLYPFLYFPGTTFISAITLGTTTTIDTTDAHNFVVGQEVAFRIPSQWGTVELNSLPNTLTPGSPVYGYVIAVTDYNTVVVNIDSSAFTAFTSNPTVTSVPGLSYPQIVAVGDVNTGGVQISSGSVLYPPPYFVPIGTTRFNTINGPAIQGAFVNNTSQGFIVGAGAGTVLTTSSLVGAAGNVIIWQAFLHDYSNP
ncbi:MAG TPA: ubiquitin-activating E1 FCCH domain-containing protein [Nitrosopumilaceae archaeon]|nr:ubiquitin-activating E1 FCCH domain-containing protein [Nitrosopumilaceae archaeon]